MTRRRVRLRATAALTAVVAMSAAAVPAVGAVSAPVGPDGAGERVGPAEVNRVRLEVASVSWRTGRPANHTQVARMSSDGRRMLIWTRSKRLIPDPPRDGSHFYVRDVWADKTSVVTALSDGTPVPGNRYNGGAISGDGRFAAFNWAAPEMSPTGHHADQYVYVKNLVNGRLDATRIRPSGPTAGVQLQGVDVWAISANGRYVAGNAAFDVKPISTSVVFLLDRRTGRVRWASPTDGRARLDSISPDGRYVVYSNYPLNGSDCGDYRYDRITGRSTLIPNGPMPDRARLGRVWFSGDGRFMVGHWCDTFSSRFLGIVYRTGDMTIVETRRRVGPISYTGRYLAVSAQRDDHERAQAYRYDRRTGRYTLMSVNADGEPANKPAWAVDISADGRTVAIRSSAHNLVPGDKPGWVEFGEVEDAFVATIRPCRGRLCLPRR